MGTPYKYDFRQCKNTTPVPQTVKYKSLKLDMEGSGVVSNEKSDPDPYRNGLDLQPCLLGQFKTPLNNFVTSLVANFVTRLDDNFVTSLVHLPVRTMFLSSSQPMPPAPTTRMRDSLILVWRSLARTPWICAILSPRSPDCLKGRAAR